MATKSQLFTSSGTWTAPEGVSAVIVASVGGGGGTAKSDSECAPGGGGSGEMMMGKMIPVIPGTTYDIIVGTKGLASSNVSQGVRPTIEAGPSTFFGFRTLGAKNYESPIGNACALNSGAGGGVGGNVGMQVGDGIAAHNGVFIGHLEARHFTGGTAGGPGGGYNESAGVAGGTVPTRGLPTLTSFTTAGGGGGGGTYWGGTNGGDYQTPTPIPHAAANHYGAGAGGPGAQGPGNPGKNEGGDGAGGCVLIMWYD